MSVCPSGFKLKHFLRDNETLSSFLRRNASFPEDAVQQVLEADINLEKVRSFTLNHSQLSSRDKPLTFLCRCSSEVMEST